MHVLFSLDVRDHFLETGAQFDDPAVCLFQLPDDDRSAEFIFFSLGQSGRLFWDAIGVYACLGENLPLIIKKNILQKIFQFDIANFILDGVSKPGLKDRGLSSSY